MPSRSTWLRAKRSLTRRSPLACRLPFATRSEAEARARSFPRARRQRRDGDPLNESLTLRNAGNDPADPSGYVIDLSGGQRDSLPKTARDPGAAPTVRVDSGTDIGADYYPGQERAALSDGGDTVTLLGPGSEVSTRRVDA